ncbi:Kap122 protein [Martiniozyma asiatica (nom. inval.)]|nr:Kap122 protein [Martiniozyma asiatica]
MYYDLEEVIKLVELLYSPQQTGDVIRNAQSQILNLQHQSFAPQLGHDLLALDSQTCQYIGALCFAVYISDHENEIDREFADKVVVEFLTAVERKCSKMVIQKLISNVSRLYIILKENIFSFIFDRLQQLNLNETDLFELGLLLSQITVDELSKTENLSLTIHEMVHSYLFPMSQSILQNSINSTGPSNLWFGCVSSWISYVSKAEFDTALRFDLNNQFSICIDLLIDKSIEAIDLLLELFDINPSLLNKQNKMRVEDIIFGQWSYSIIEGDDEELIGKISKIIAIHLDNNLLAIAARLANPKYDNMFNFLLQISNIQKIPILEEPISKDLLDFWVLFVEAFDYDEDTIRGMLKGGDFKLLKSRSQAYFTKLAEIYWQKCHLIQSDELNDIEDEFRIYRRDICELFSGLFTQLRTSLFKYLSLKIQQQLALIENSNVTQIEELVIHIESSLLILDSFQDFLPSTNDLNDIRLMITELIKSRYFELVRQFLINPSNNDSKKYRYIPYMIQTTINFLSGVTWFYKEPKNSDNLPIVITFLFQCMESNQNFETFNLNNTAAKAILKICQGCRTELIPFITDFENAVLNMLKVSIMNISDTEEIDTGLQEKLTTSYSTIIQAINNPEEKAQLLSRMLDMLYQVGLNITTNLKSTNNSTELIIAKNQLKVLLVTFVGLAKGLKIPNGWEEYYENLEQSTGDGNIRELMKEVTVFWLNDPYKIHSKILEFIGLYVPFFTQTGIGAEDNLSSDVEYMFIEQICDFFKDGLDEEVPGPFAIDLAHILKFISMVASSVSFIDPHKKSSNNVRLTSCLTLYRSVIKFISAQSRLSPQMINILREMNSLKKPSAIELPHMIDMLFLRHKDAILNDPDLTSAEFSLLGSISNILPSVFIPQENVFGTLDSISFIQIITLALHQQLISHERFVIKDICEFWIALIKNKRANKVQKDFVSNFLSSPVLFNFLSPQLISLIGNNTPTYGQLLTLTLFTNLLNSPRSNVQFPAELLRQLTSEYPAMIKNWLEFSMLELIKSNKINQKASSIFIQKMVISRGARVAKSLVTEWWGNVRGLGEY